jgi:molecular chaperone DnaK
VDKLNTTSAALGQAMYAAAQAAQQAPSEAGSPSESAETNGSGGPSANADEDVVDAEIIDEDASSEAK